VKVFIVLEDYIGNEYYTPVIVAVCSSQEKADERVKHFDAERNCLRGKPNKLYDYEIVEYVIDEEN